MVPSDFNFFFINSVIIGGKVCVHSIRRLSDPRFYHTPDHLKKTTPRHWCLHTIQTINQSIKTHYLVKIPSFSHHFAASVPVSSKVYQPTARCHTIRPMFLFSRDWRISHAMSHHLHTNTAQDIELAMLEPFLLYLTYSKKTIFEKFASIYWPIVYSVASVMMLAKE